MEQVVRQDFCHYGAPLPARHCALPPGLRPEASVDHVGEASFEGPARFGGCFTFGDLAAVVLLPAAAVLGWKAADAADVPEDLGREDGPEAGQRRKHCPRRRQRVSHLGFVVLDQ